jgi:hypothetical protein
MEDVTETGKKLLNEELHNPYSPPNSKRLINSSISRTRFVAGMEEKKNAYRF